MAASVAVAGAKRIVSNQRLQPSVTITDTDTEMFVVRWSPDGAYVAAGAGDGSISVFSSTTGKMAFELQQGSAAALPATSLRFRPSNDATRTKNVLVSTNAVGAIQHWHVTSGKCLHTMVEENDNQIFALDYRPDGMQFATAGKDTFVRVYDEATKALAASLKSGLGYGSSVTSGHSNRVFSVKFHPTDENLLVSGGWDNTVQVWDVRAGHSVSSIFGPHLCGDGLDVCVDPKTKRTTMLAGSWRAEAPLELWDLDSGKLLEQVPWKESLMANQPCLLYAAQFSKSGASPARFVAAGGSGANEARVYDRMGGTMSSHAGVDRGPGNTALVGTVAGLARGVFSVDWSPVEEKVAIGTGDGSIRILQVVERKSGDEEEAQSGGDAECEGPKLVDVRAAEEDEVEAEPERDVWDEAKDGKSDDES